MKLPGNVVRASSNRLAVSSLYSDRMVRGHVIALVGLDSHTINKIYLESHDFSVRLLSTISIMLEP